MNSVGFNILLTKEIVILPSLNFREKKCIRKLLKNFGLPHIWKIQLFPLCFGIVVIACMCFIDISRSDFK